MKSHADWIGSPGMGTTPVFLSREPLATEGEATRGPDDDIDFDELEDASFGVGPAPALDLDLDGDDDVTAPNFGLPRFGFGGDI